MKSLRPIANLWRERVVGGWYRWALREISPLHPDLPELVLKLANLEARHASKNH